MVARARRAAVSPRAAERGAGLRSACASGEGGAREGGEGGARGAERDDIEGMDGSEGIPGLLHGQVAAAANQRRQQGEEQQHGDLKAARRWLDEASTASKDNAWYCESCGSVAEKWGASCINCGSFATIIWKFPPGQNQNGLRDTEGKENLDLKNEHDKTAVLRSSKSHLLTT